MNKNASGFIRIVSVLILLSAASVASAGDVFYNGGYLAPMGTAMFSDGRGDLGTRGGGTMVFGYRQDFYAFEARGMYGESLKKGSNAFFGGGTISGSLFPFRLGNGAKPDDEGFEENLLTNFYLHFGGGGLEVRKYPDVQDSIPMKVIQAGVGDLLPMRWGDYKFGIRLEALYQYGHRSRDPEDKSSSAPDVDAPRRFGDFIVNLGLHLPLGSSPQAAPVPAAAPQVVAPTPVCADSIDNDGDGKVDFPADPGCQSATDEDESDPLPPPCEEPMAGEKVSLHGCGTGDVIVLRGVNFEFDKATLTTNARVLLDGVSEELLAYPEIKVELSGHTDALGSDEYNQALSQRRAESVVSYLIGKGVAADRMTSIGYGEAKPVAENATEEGRELNRRVELKVTEGVGRVAESSAPPVSPAVVAEPANTAEEVATPVDAP